MSTTEHTPLVRMLPRRQPSILTATMLLTIAFILASVTFFIGSDTPNRGFPMLVTRKSDHPDTICHRKHFRKETLKLIAEAPISSLVDITNPLRVFEASDVVFTIDKNKDIYIVLDNSFHIIRLPLAARFFHHHFTHGHGHGRGHGYGYGFGHGHGHGHGYWHGHRHGQHHSPPCNSPYPSSSTDGTHGHHGGHCEHATEDTGSANRENVQVGAEGAESGGREYGILEWPGEEQGDSQFEYIAYNATSGSFLVGQEVHKVGDELKSRVFDVKLGDNGTQVLESCIIDYIFSGDNKGIEGGAIVSTPDGASYLLALCEGNNCRGGDEGRAPGNGRILVLRRGYVDGVCVFDLVDTVKIPHDVRFEDYSGIGVWGSRKIAVTSQVESAVYIADLEVGAGGVRLGHGSVYQLPRNDACEVKYCNVEGVSFVTETVLVAVSDRMKSKGKQHFRCREKDESVHLFEYYP